jgi:hypothetical protein
VTKQEQFLYIVQTALLANGIHLATEPTIDRATAKHNYSATGVLIVMDDALYASERMPEDKTAFEAAHDFCYFAFENLRSPEQSCPEWFARH